MVEKRFSDQIAIVTGASSGIGRATALALANSGANVVLAARREAELIRVAGEIERLERQALVIPTDVTCREAVVRLVNCTLERWGRLDILVANSGQYLCRPIQEVDYPILDRSMNVNFYGAVNAILAVLPNMLARGRGHIVLVSSMDVKIGLPGDAPYVAAKSALSGFGAVLRQELNGTGVHVTTVFPGRVDTAMIDHLEVPSISAKIPPEAVANAIVLGIKRQSAEIFLPPQTKILSIMNALSPTLTDWAARKFHLQGWEIN